MYASHVFDCGSQSVIAMLVEQFECCSAAEFAYHVCFTGDVKIYIETIKSSAQLIAVNQ